MGLVHPHCDHDARGGGEDSDCPDCGGEAADRYGTTAYAILAAAWGMPLTLVNALAPLATVLLWHAAGLTVVLDAAAVCCLLGAVGLVVSEHVPYTLPSQEQAA